MDDRFTRLPTYLADRSRTQPLGTFNTPALLAHPDWQAPAPFVIWMHGRTVTKETDPGRYLRWIRSGIAAVAVDLPGHGQRYVEGGHSPEQTLDNLDQMVREIDHILEALSAPEFQGAFDLDRAAIGGMSAGGMAALRRLCDPHPFTCAAVESTTGNLEALYFPTDDSPGRPWPVDHPPERVAALDPIKHLGTWQPIPLLAIHSERDAIVPWQGQHAFLTSLANHYRAQSADPALIETLTWESTGAPEEHAGFGRMSNDAKNAQLEFFQRHLNPTPQ